MAERPGLRFVGRILHEAREDAITGEAAKVAYYFFLSLFPMILALFAFTGILGGNDAFEWVMRHLRDVLPGEAAEYLAGFVHEVTGSSRPGMLSLGLALSVWAASNAFAWLMRALNIVFDVAEGRPWWKRRAVALVAMVAMLTAISIGAAALLSGPDLFARIGLAAGWRLARWPAVVVLLTTTMAVIYGLLPNRARRAPLRPVLIGAAAGTSLWVLATVAFRLYLSSFGRFAATYGFVGGVIVLLLWLYLSALAILSGAEVAATLEQSARKRG